MHFREDWKIKGRPLFRVYKMTAQAWDERVSLKREVLHRSSLKEDRVLEVDSAFTRQEQRGVWWVIVMQVRRAPAI